MSDIVLTDYQKYIHQSRYARYRDDLGRRETWAETVHRYMDFFVEELERKYRYKVPLILQSEIYDGIHGQHVLPSMRGLMTAGEAARRNNVCLNNCSYLPIQDLFSFAELFYILMCGTGVGFSVERQVICGLPPLPRSFSKIDKTIVVEDSKEGWAHSFYELLKFLFNGEIPKIDYSLIRPAGSRLVIFGGRASGPEPLRELFEFTIETVTSAEGKKLNSLECHEIACKAGEAVVVGGVRRAALISLSNLSDLRMRNAKSGDWYVTKKHLALANNSTANTEKPEVDVFMEEWLSVYKSHSGERGFFNRDGVIKKLSRIGKRNTDFEFGCNPCLEILLRPFQFCNLSTSILRSDDTIKEIKEKATLAAILGTWQSAQTDFKFIRSDWKNNCEEERLLGVSFTGIFDNELMRQDVCTMPQLGGILEEIKHIVNDVNYDHALAIGINPSVSTTCIKPEGTTSQFVDCASGIHAGHSEYFLRRIREDNKNPITAFMKSAGFPNEKCVHKPEDITIFTFPRKSNGSKTRENITTKGHMDLVLLYGKHWAEHTVSCTISVKKDEWPMVGGYVYDHFDDIIGMSFLPYFTESTVYKQLPYETITKEQYEEFLEKMPKDVDWSKLAEFDAGTDQTTGSQEFACTGNGCDLS